ncbi:MAG TPA: peptide chain release factor 3 [Acidimicrobiia bacterium]|nr:peptide chain release factor 3 [Acidimicrobiia bacterium]
MADAIATEARRRRTFAIISHPDAGKTTLTEKLLLFSGVIGEAGAVGARSGRREVTSDWMEMERSRGISITSTVLQFEVGDRLFNLLDTPGHRDFSEDTYRVLSAVDSAVIVIDGAKGIESQTLKLFQVAQARGIPLVTFVNKCDRPGMAPLEILDDIESQLGIAATPVTWPVGSGQAFQGVVDRRDATFWEFERTARGTKIGAERELKLDEELAAGDEWREAALGELALLDAVEANHDIKRFMAGESTPVFFGSALWNFGVRLLLDAIDTMAPSPLPRDDAAGEPRALDSGVSGFIFKIQANLDPRHRDRVAYMRLCTGRFERGMTLTSNRTGRSFGTKYAHQVFGRERDTVEVAYPGDIVGLVNAGDLLIGDSLSVDGAVRYPAIPTFAPEYFRVARNLDTSRYKQFRKGITQLDEEGVIQILRTEEGGDREPILAAVGEMQYEVAMHRLQHEFGAEVLFESTPWNVARRTDDIGAGALSAIRGVEVARRSSGIPVALFTNRHRLEAVERDHPDLLLDPIIAL